MRLASPPRLLAAALGLGAAAIAFAAASCAQPSSPLASSGDEASAGQGGQAGQGGKSGQGGQAGAGGQAGQGGQAAAGQGGSGGGALDDGGSAGAMDATADVYDPDVAPDVFIDPDGPPELQVMNGVTDHPAVRFCLLPWNGGEPAGDAQPFPMEALAYGQHAKAEPPSGFDPEASEVRPLVIAGDPGSKGCAALFGAPPEGVRVSALPVLPPGTLSAPRSLLLVAAGCMGSGPGAMGVPDPDYACGQGVKADVGNARMVLVELSRKAPPADGVGLQVLHASAAMGKIDVRAQPSGDAPAVSIVASLGVGQVAPRPPGAFPVDTLFGFSPVSAQIRLVDSQQGKDYGLYPVGSDVEASGLDPAQVLAAGSGLVVVVLGPRPGTLNEASTAQPTRLVWLRAPSL